MKAINRQPPTIRELAHVVGWTPSKVHRTLLLLRRAKKASWEYNLSRTLEVKKPNGK